MKKLLSGLLAALFLCAPAFAQAPLVQADKSAAISTASAATTEIVAAVTGLSVKVTHFDFIAAGATNVTLVYGTGSNCATGTTSLTGAYPLTAQAGIAAGNGSGIIIPVPVSKALCVTNSAAVQVSGLVSYKQDTP